MDMGKDNSESSAEQIIIDRVRHFRQFETPSLMKCVDEITFYNTGQELPTIKYILGTFRPSLHIFDSNGQQLEFYSSTNSEKKENREIYIDFPKQKPLSNGEFRTIKLEYVQEVKASLSDKLKLTIPLHETASVYTFIEQCENYGLSVHYGVLDANNCKVENLNQTIVKGDSFFNIYYKAVKNNSNLYLFIVLQHKITKTLSDWYNMSIIFGVISAISLPFLYHYNPYGVTGIATYAAFVISYLFIIKGWLFSKNMDKKMIKYDKRYQYLIWVIFLEITLMTIHYGIIFIRQ